MARVASASIARKVNREVVVVIGWGRAILLQVAHPLVAAGVADHSNFRGDAVGYLRRTHHTIAAMLGLTFGSPEEIRRRADRINEIHARVHGTLRHPTARFPAGTTYSAGDPELLRWVHATLVDSQLLTYGLFVGTLAADEKDQYCAEAAGIGPLLGTPNHYLPASVHELRSYLDTMLASDEIEVTPAARHLANALLFPPGGALTGPLLGLGRLVTVGHLPPAIREAYGFEWNSRRERLLARATGVLRRVRALLPPLLRQWPAARASA